MIQFVSMDCRISKETAVSNFRKNYPDFASIEHHIRQAHAERSVAIATGFADGIVAVLGAISRLVAGKQAPRARNGNLVVKASVERRAARV